MLQGGVQNRRGGIRVREDERKIAAVQKRGTLISVLLLSN